VHFHLRSTRPTRIKNHLSFFIIYVYSLQIKIMPFQMGRHQQYTFYQSIIEMTINCTNSWDYLHILFSLLCVINRNIYLSILIFQKRIFLLKTAISNHPAMSLALSLLLLFCISNLKISLFVWVQFSNFWINYFIYSVREAKLQNKCLWQRDIWCLSDSMIGTLQW
jgi:hypothetical protein